MAPNFATGCCDPHAAYALGMVVKMLHMQQLVARSPLSASTKSSSDDASAAATNAVALCHVQLGKLQRVLESPLVSLSEKQALVAMIENAESAQDVWTFLDRMHSDSDSDSDNRADSDVATAAVAVPATDDDASDAVAHCEHNDTALLAIPEELGCAICCSDLMLEPVSLACGHSFCRYCLELWRSTRATCPTCRFAVPATEIVLHVNVALQHVIATFYPQQLQMLATQSASDRFEQLRLAIHTALSTNSSNDDLRDVLARLRTRTGQQQRDQSLAISLVLETDVELHERVLAAEIHERLRKERLLRESSRRRHTAAYGSNAPSLSAQVNPALLQINSSTTTVRRNGIGSGDGGGGSGRSSSSSNLLATFLNRKS